MTNRSADIGLRLVSRFRAAARLACLLTPIGLLGVGCTAAREPLALIEPDYSYHNDNASADETLSRLYAVPLKGEDTVAAAGRLDVVTD